jgi:hypothetical protein
LLIDGGSKEAAEIESTALELRLGQNSERLLGLREGDANEEAYGRSESAARRTRREIGSLFSHSGFLQFYFRKTRGSALFRPHRLDDLHRLDADAGHPLQKIDHLFFVIR